jgi:hypothetical protein
VTADASLTNLDVVAERVDNPYLKGSRNDRWAEAAGTARTHRFNPNGSIG